MSVWETHYDADARDNERVETLASETVSSIDAAKEFVEEFAQQYPPLNE